MPVAPQHSSIFSSIRNAFHSSPHHNPSAVAPDPPTPSTASPSSSTLDHHRLQLYNTFESNLTQRLSSISPPGDDSPCVNLASLKQFLHVLLATQTDLEPLIPAHQYPLSQAQVRMMEEFLERSVKILDVCRAIKEQISDVERSQGMLHAVLFCLSAKNGGVLHIGQVVRARKALAELLLRTEVETGQESSVQLYRSFRFRDTGAGDSGPDTPQRWRSWHGSSRLSGLSSGSSSPASQPSRQLQAIGSVFTVPRLAAGDVEEYLCAAIYALTVISIFFLGTLTASLPSLNRVYVPSFVHPRSFSWAPPLFHLQEKVQEELKWRGKKNRSYAGMWELDQIATIVRRLFELTEDDDCALGDKAKEEIKNLVKQLKQHVEELDRDLLHLHTQLMDFYNHIISSRMEILDKLGKFRP
ncbi:hypothetical protein GOP47_0030464 [Adiantum capillus-veneris]|nr:hypothetical protein GOP47_0030464 [Adiantum capillus-veneris]